MSLAFGLAMRISQTKDFLIT